jgi:hypothetical protein
MSYGQKNRLRERGESRGAGVAIVVFFALLLLAGFFAMHGVHRHEARDREVEDALEATAIEENAAVSMAKAKDAAVEQTADRKVEDASSREANVAIETNTNKTHAPTMKASEWERRVKATELVNDRREDLQWLIDSQYWNPKKAALTDAELAALRSLLKSGKDDLNATNKKWSDQIIALNSKKISSGEAKPLALGQSIPNSTTDLNYSVTTSGEKLFLIETKRDDYPQLFVDRDACDAKLFEVHDSVIGFFDKISKH